MSVCSEDDNDYKNQPAHFYWKKPGLNQVLNR